MGSESGANIRMSKCCQYDGKGANNLCCATAKGSIALERFWEGAIGQAPAHTCARILFADDRVGRHEDFCDEDVNLANA